MYRHGDLVLYIATCRRQAQLPADSSGCHLGVDVTVHRQCCVLHTRASRLPSKQSTNPSWASKTREHDYPDMKHRKHRAQRTWSRSRPPRYQSRREIQRPWLGHKCDCWVGEKSYAELLQYCTVPGEYVEGGDAQRNELLSEGATLGMSEITPGAQHPSIPPRAWTPWPAPSRWPPTLSSFHHHALVQSLSCLRPRARFFLEMAC